MHHRINISLCLLLSFVLFSNCSRDDNDVEFSNTLERVAFGSCAMQVFPSGIYNQIVNKKPNLYLAMGDNIYADNILGAKDFPEWMSVQYSLLEAKPEFKNLRAQVPIMSTWDDHDYGDNNASENFEYKDTSKQIFLNFWKVPQNDERRTREGIYTSAYYGEGEERVQVIMLDTRWNMTDLGPEPIQVSNDPNAKILGAKQWEWLREELQKPAKVRLIGSSIQFGTQPNGFETWGNFKFEQEKMFNLIKETRAEGVIFISGDVHYAEISKREVDGLYPIYDVTSSGLTHQYAPATTNMYRVGEAFTQLNFGMLYFDWKSVPAKISMCIFNVNGALVRRHDIDLNELKF